MNIQKLDRYFWYFTAVMLFVVAVVLGMGIGEAAVPQYIIRSEDLTGAFKVIYWVFGLAITVLSPIYFAFAAGFAYIKKAYPVSILTLILAINLTSDVVYVFSRILDALIF